MCNFAAQSANIPDRINIMSKTIFDAQDAAYRRLESLTGNIRTWIAVDATTCKSVVFRNIADSRDMKDCYIFRAERIAGNARIELYKTK